MRADILRLRCVPLSPAAPPVPAVGERERECILLRIGRCVCVRQVVAAGGGGEEPGGTGEGEGELRPAITMPGGRSAYRDYDDDRPPSSEVSIDR